jgi:hypothetical protein
MAYPYGSPYDEEDKRSALTQGLLAAGLAALGARKGSEYNAFAQAGLLGLGGYGRALEGATEARDRKAQREMQAQQWQMTQQEHALKLKAMQDAQEREQRMGGVYSGMPTNTPVAGVSPRTAAQFGSAGGDSTGMTPMPPAPVTRASPYDQLLQRAEYLQAQAQQNPRDAKFLIAEADKYIDAANKWRDKNRGDMQPVRGPDGKLVMVQGREYGDAQATPYQPKPQWSMQDTGGSIQPVDLSGVTTPTAMTKTMTFADRNSAATLGLSRERFAWDKGQANKPTLQAETGTYFFPPDQQNPTGRAVTAAGFTKKADKPDKPTDPQLQAQGYYLRMSEASKTLDKHEAAGYVPGWGSGAIAGVKSVPYAGALPGFVMDLAGSKLEPRMHSYKQSQADWVRAKMRKESGAVIGEQEMVDEIRTYFPQPTDTPADIRQKAKARKVAEQAMLLQARGVGTGQEDPLGVR